MLSNTATRFAFLSPLLTALLLIQPLNGAAPPALPDASIAVSSSPSHVSLAPAVAAALPTAAVQKPRARRSVLRSSRAAFFLGGAAQPGTPADPTDPYIVAEATTLNNDPNAIFAFVRDQVANQVYAGSLRGARGTLWSMGGNSFDKASLLIALLGAAGVQSQYAQGTLGATDAANAILTMFPTPTIVAGCIPPGTTLASPQTDPTLLATAANHYWVQYGATNAAADPSVPGAQLGQSFATASQTFTSIPAALKQMVTITLNVETYSELGQYGTAPQLIESYETDLLSGRPISFGTNLAESISGGGFFGPQITTLTYTPYLLLGQADSDIEQDPVVQGTAFSEAQTGNVLFASWVTGLFLQIRAPDYTGTMQTYQHTILDRVGYANRQVSPLPSPTLPAVGTPAIIPAQIVTMDILPGLQAQDATTFTNQKTRINNEQTSLNTLQPQLASLPTSGTLTATQQTLVNSVILAEDDLEIALGELAALSFAATADRILSQAELEYRTSAYYNSPRLILVSTSATGTFSLDLLKRDIEVIASPGQNAGVPVWFEETRGMIESSSEASVLNSTLGQTSYDITSVFAAANGNFVALAPWVVGQTMPNLSADAVARIQTALTNNKFVIAPATTPIVNGSPLEGWMETDMNTGETVSTFANGDHQGFSEYDASLLSALFGKKSSIIGLVSGAGIVGFSFMAGVLNGVAAFAATGKDSKGKVVCVKGTSDCSSAPLAASVITQFNALNAAIAKIDPSKVCVPKIGCNDAQKSILSSLANGMAVGAGYSEEILLRSLPSDPEVVPFLSTNIAPAPAAITPGSTPGVNLLINLDQYFTAATTNGTEVPTVFVANIQNTGPATDTFRLTFGSVPGYQVESSLNSVTIPAGQTAQVGVCLVPTGTTAPAATFTANVGSATNKSVTSSSTTGVNGGVVGVSETIQTSPAGLQVSIDGGNPQTAPVSVNWQAGSKHTIAATSPQGSNGTQYTFRSWSDAGALSHTVTAVSTVTTYTASFSTAYQLTASASPSAGGTISPATGSYYSSGTVVNLTATPKSGYKFTGWTGNVASSTSAATSVTMNSPQTVTANFATNNSSFTINTVPAGLQVVVDNGAPQAAPVSVSWQLGSSHTISTISPQGSDGTK